MRIKRTIKIKITQLSQKLWYKLHRLLSYTILLAALLHPSSVFVMAWRSRGTSNSDLIEQLKTLNLIKSTSVYNAMNSVDRGKYVSYNPYSDSPQLLMKGVTISAPHMHASALELLKDQLKPGKRALDVGSGSGYLTACMAQMVNVSDGNGAVIGVDLLPELTELSRNNIANDKPELLSLPNFKLICSNGWEGGPPEFAPYHAIHVGAAASEVPRRLIEQLANGGKMVIPVGTHVQELMEISKDENGNVTHKSLFGVQYVELKKSI